MSEKVCIFLPSSSKKVDRIKAVRNKLEWEAWGFDKDSEIAIRKRNEIKGLKRTDLDNELNSCSNMNLVIWINTNIIEKPEERAKVLKKISEKLPNHQIYILSHAEDYDPNIFKPSGRIKEKEYSLSDSKVHEKQWENVLLPLRDVNKDLDELIEKLIKEFFLNPLLLAHCIAHLFLPLDIDLQGISEVLKSNDENWAEQYYNDAFKNKGRSRLESKIEEAKKLIEKFPGDKKSEILKFLDKNELKEVKNALKNWENTKRLLKEKNLFHSWFCELMKCLESLRKESK